jgi:hypothetical protein
MSYRVQCPFCSKGFLTPDPSGSAAALGDILAQYNAMADGKAKADFLRDHANELLRAARKIEQPMTT